MQDGSKVHVGLDGATIAKEASVHEEGSKTIMQIELLRTLVMSQHAVTLNKFMELENRIGRVETKIEKLEGKVESFGSTLGQVSEKVSLLESGVAYTQSGLDILVGKLKSQPGFE